MSEAEGSGVLQPGEATMSGELFLAAHGVLPEGASPDACPFLGMVAQLGLDEAGVERLLHALATAAGTAISAESGGQTSEVSPSPARLQARR